jgi:hypothetical protein
VSALFEAELSECSMNGNLCGLSTGEALSRWCAAEIGNNALSDFATAPQWVSDGMPDFVSKTDPTDQSADSTGCGMAFLSWLISQGFALGKIAPTMVSLGNAGTLAQLYGKLTPLPSSICHILNLPSPIDGEEKTNETFCPSRRSRFANHIVYITIGSRT